MNRPYYGPTSRPIGTPGWGVLSTLDRLCFLQAGGDQLMAAQAKLVDRLRELARNLWWVWQPNVTAIFRDLDPGLWQATDHNPVEFLQKIDVAQLETRAAELALDSRIDNAFRR